MPSQRLLKMLDPLGHVPGPTRVLASAAPKAVVWAGSPKLATWIARELATAGIEALGATSFRHVSSSLGQNARPAVSLAVIDLDATTEMDVASLTSARWMGYRGALIGVARTVAPRSAAQAALVAVLDLDDVVAHDSPDLGVALARWTARTKRAT